MRRRVAAASVFAASSSTRRSRAQIATSTPSPASSWAFALPMTLGPPVTIATFPASPRSMCNPPPTAKPQVNSQDQAGERLAHLPPELPRAKSNQHRGDHAEREEGHHASPAAGTLLLW